MPSFLGKTAHRDGRRERWGKNHVDQESTPNRGRNLTKQDRVPGTGGLLVTKRKAGLTSTFPGKRRMMKTKPTTDGKKKPTLSLIIQITY